MARNETNIGTLRWISTSPLSIEWGIDDYFKRLHIADSSYESPNFIFGKAVWRLRLYPYGERKQNTVGKSELFLLREDSFDEAYDISCTVGVNIENYTIGSYVNCSMTFNKCNQINAAFIINGLELERWRTYVLDHNKILTILVKDLVIHNKPNTNTDSKTQIPQMDKATSTDEILQVKGSRSDELNTEKEGLEILSENLKGLFLNEEDCDVTFKIENVEIRAHKYVLIARSPVFASMFRHKMSETITGIVKIADCTPDAFKALLLYLYSGIVENLSADIVYDLYEASVKYDLEYLKNKCIKFMKSGMSSDTLCDTIALCQKYNEVELLQHATNYFTEHSLDILLTVKWQLFMKEDPVTANELYIKAMQKTMNNK